ncbi:MAG: isoprenylcysteine carboxylmethyltransferase family protein [Candidatus Acidiferrales bacterium]|jgi:protein-S-isoprenylcysteine O-methyltransferase Ste14
MAFRSDPLAELAYFVVLAGWLGFVVIMVLGKRGSASGAAKRDVKSTVGMLLQGAGYAICFGFFRTFFSPFLPMSKFAEEILTGVTIALVIVSVWLCWAAARTLGKQWALVARVIEGHELITAGPYAIVRNPIYLSMLGMFLASALAVSRWQALLGGLIVFLAGTAIRIRTEEKLLRETFAARFDDYARRVPALLPRLLR